MSVEVSQIDVQRDRAFDNHIESLTTYRFKDCDTVRFVPEGRVELLFQVGSRFLHRTPSDRTWMQRPSGFVGGLHDHAYHVKALDGKASCVGIKFKPGSANHFMRCPLIDLRNKVVAIEEIWGPAAREMTLAANSSSAGEVAEKIRPFLMAQFAKPSVRDQKFITNSIAGTVNRERIKKLAESLGLSASHFRKKFADNVGLAPSQYAKILTIGQAIQRLQSNDYESLTELALELGYYDQAHFIRAFRSITGTTPSKYSAKAL